MPKSLVKACPNRSLSNSLRHPVWVSPRFSRLQPRENRGRPNPLFCVQRNEESSDFDVCAKYLSNENLLTGQGYDNILAVEHGADALFEDGRLVSIQLTRTANWPPPLIT